MQIRTAPRPAGASTTLATAVLVAVLMQGSSFAQQSPPPSSPAQVVMSPGYQFLLSRLQASQTLEHYLEGLRIEFFQVDADSDGKITQRDIDLHGLMETIQARTFGVTMVMRYDLDGDGFVTEDEIRRTMRYDLRAQRAQTAIKPAGNGPNPLELLEKQIDTNVGVVMALDTDKDGKVGFEEAGKFSLGGTKRGVTQYGQSARARQVLTLDTASKGEVSQADYQAAGDALFRKIDADHDGKISPQEWSDYRNQPAPPDAVSQSAASDAAQARLKAEAEFASKAACDMPRASEKAKVVLLTGYETDALSNTTLGSQDVVIHAGRVNVEPGPDPLYVVISTYSSTIWQFNGSVERIERLVLSSSRTGPNSGDPRQPVLVGATGIPADRVSFVRSNCIGYFYEAPTSVSLQVGATVQSKVGRAPDVVSAKYSVGSYSVPSGKVETVREQRQQPLVIQKSEGTLNIVGDPRNVIIQAKPSRARDDMTRFFPGGVTEIDPKTVVASVPALPYEVLPSQAGLVQLLATGALTQNSEGEYVVRQKIRFPAGLYGGHSATFLVMKGAPYPEGDPGHSCVVVEETGAGKGPNCRTR